MKKFVGWLKKSKKRLSRITLFFLGSSALIFLLSWQIVESPHSAVKNFASSPLIYDQTGQLYHVRLSKDNEWLIPVKLSAMSPWLPKVAVGIEDKRFYRHGGVDFIALGRAFGQNIFNLRKVSGASTISSQLVRVSIPRKRNLLTKYVEFIQALKIDSELTKDEILELYLNRAPFGGNIRGVEAAARIYFNKSAKDLSLGESTLLISIVCGPAIYRPDRHPQRAQKRRDFLLTRLLKNQIITLKEYEAARQEPVKSFRVSLPKKAWHFSVAALEKYPEGISSKKQTDNIIKNTALQSTINLDWQEKLEKNLEKALVPFPQWVTGAGAVMDNQNGAILAYVGNARHTDKNPAWLNCAQAPRSPGSVLKPFFYLQAFAKGLITPASLLADTPIKMKGQAPRNFDRRYRGPVSAKKALSESLNAPSVRVLRLVGLNESLAFLQNLGFSFFNQSAKYYGDSMVLGGGEVNLEQVLKAYSTLARNGAEIEPTFLRDKLHENSQQKFSQGAAWLTNYCLLDMSRLPPFLQAQWSETAKTHQGFAFKTGTSHGLRDVWLAAYTPNYTLVLWLGAPGGQGHHQLQSMEALAPAAFQLMSELENLPGQHSWPPYPINEVESFKACALSGDPASPFDPQTITAYRLKKFAKTHPCRLHINKSGQVEINWPLDLAEFIAVNEQQTTQKLLTQKPVIVSPRPGLRIIMETENAKLPFSAEGNIGQTSWFVDGKFYASSAAGEKILWPLSPGQHQLSLTDAEGRTAMINFQVLRKEKLKDLSPLLFFKEKTNSS